MSIEVQVYSPEWRQQVIDLTVQEYPYMHSWFETRFVALHENYYQTGRNRIIIAREGNKLAGCISWVHWPLAYMGRETGAGQMVGLVVDPAFRGRGVFGKMLAELDRQAAAAGVSCLFGFPVPVSKPGFEKQGWKNVFDLDWFVAPVNPLAIFRKTFSAEGFSSTAPDNLPGTTGFLQTAADADFWKYRKDFSPEWPDYWFHASIEGKPISLVFRIQQRMGLNEAVIGKIYGGEAESFDIRAFLKLFIRQLRAEGSIALTSASVNISCQDHAVQAVRARFFRSGKKMHFIAKHYGQHDYYARPEEWNIWRADMETW
jgi:GNAT superfamily N-acetyltransferase